ncbi:ABC transporter ATP-binding protein [Chloroflexi bacterium TSY]|nr:ABC transporter ATP-binding protein [Chloroflexi bacterium TSY]
MPLLKLAEHYFYILSRFFRVDSFFRPFRFALCHSSLYQKVKLDAKSLSKIYETETTTIRAVDDTTISVAEGEFVALVGPSGSGKTTLLALFAGLLDPDKGEVSINGHKLSQMKEGQRTHYRLHNIGFTFQANNLVSYLTVQENVELILQLNGKLDKAGKARVMNLLDRLGLAERRNNLPSQLSGGQQQRVAIARTLAHDPSIVLADEPTASLDTELAYQVVETFADLIHEQRRAGIMVTHDLRMCIYADRVIQMLDGRIDAIVSDREAIHAFANQHRTLSTPTRLSA